MNERRRFMADYQSGQWTMTELCARYGVSRKTGYARLARFREDGEASFEDRSGAPLSCAHQTPEAVDDLMSAIASKRGRVTSWSDDERTRVSATRTSLITLTAAPGDAA